MDTESIDILGYIAATLTTIAFLPQVLKTWRSRSAKDVSLVMMITFSIGVFLWLLYGLAIQAMPVILANTTTLILALLIVILKIRYR
ncbi:MAG: SemiSWEET transporter [Symplocastrum torsivum CPER-KK1]|jgi:MtN3 and saliva related transmembrane protein|uniref:SemiSWEET transporter n=1 Tax=Symplocastrum torsivum CPER-KK1 TaxID=450513 RepID=A0A951UAK4_9CYAN|nr:SemiSWEET transporter [Symplocastrum torsivum CPER-KK1]